MCAPPPRCCSTLLHGRFLRWRRASLLGPAGLPGLVNRMPAVVHLVHVLPVTLLASPPRVVSLAQESRTALTRPPPPAPILFSAVYYMDKLRLRCSSGVLHLPNRLLRRGGNGVPPLIHTSTCITANRQPQAVVSHNIHPRSRNTKAIGKSCMVLSAQLTGLSE